MKTATATKLRSRLGTYLNEREPVVVTQNGHAKAVLVHVENEDDIERLMMANNAQLMDLLNAADERISRTGGIPHDEFWARVRKQTRTRKRAASRRAGS